MRIAIDVSQIVYEGTGVANYTSNLVRSLLKIDRKNEYILFGLSFRKLNILWEFFRELKNEHDNVSAEFLPIPQTIANFLWNRLHIINIERILGKIDVFHSSDWIQPPSKVKKITTVHDLVVYKYPQTSNPYIVNTQKKRLFWVKKESDLIIADSIATKNDLVKILKFEPDKIEVVYPGIEDDFRPVEANEVRRVKQKYALLGDYVLALGMMEPRKNLSRVVSSFEQFLDHPAVSSRKKTIELVLVGKTGWGEQVKPQKFVRFLGLVERVDLPALYSGASFFVYLSLYEGFGLPLLEAMSCGCPVITSDRGSLKEVAYDSAVFADPENEKNIASKMTELYVDKNLCKNIIEQGKINAKRFSWETAAKQIKSLYTKL